MPNWCMNLLVLDGPQELIDEFFDGMEDGVDFNKHIPLPTVACPKCKGKGRVATDSSSAIILGLEPDHPHLMPKNTITHGAIMCGPCEGHGKVPRDDWYEWSIRNWGTKWNAADAAVSGNQAGFSTAWGPPDAWFRHVAALEEYLPLEMVLSFYEPGVDMEGEYHKYPDDSLVYEVDGLSAEAVELLVPSYEG